MDNTTIKFSRITKLRLALQARLKTITSLTIIVLIIAAISTSFLPNSNRKTISTTTNSASNMQSIDTRTNVQSAISTQPLNKEFTVQVTDDNGKNLGKITYIIDNAEIRNEIVINGEKATAVKGRTFFIVNIKLKNEQEKPITVNSRDYVRLSLNGNDQEWLAPDIHNDPVEVQAISTKISRLGFPINDADKNLKLQFGEVGGEKTTMDINIHP